MYFLVRDKNMMTNKDKILELRQLNAKSLLGGGEQKILSQHKAGKMTARERLHLLFDQGYFDELNKFAGSDLKESLVSDKPIGDGVVTALGAVNGRLIHAASQDFTVMGGSVGRMHSWKICEVMNMALKNGTPFISFNDSGGARIQEGIDSLKGYGNIFYYNTLLSGVCPQIAIIAGPCAGGAAYSPALMDFIIMVDGIGKMFIAGPQVIKETTGENITAEELGGAMAQASFSGNVHFIARDDADAIEITQKLLSYLPSNNTQDPPRINNEGLFIIEDDDLNSIVPDDSGEPYDMFDILNRIFDQDSLFEVQSHFAKNIIICFARLNGMVVGVVANQPLQKFGCIDIDASDKAARFIRFCNAFNIPLISFVDVPGFLPGIEQEFGGIIRHGAKMLFAFSAATVSKVSIIIRKAYGGAYLAMSAKSLGADRVAAWPSAEIAVMGAEGAISILYGKEIKNSDNPQEKRKELIEKYRLDFANPYRGAEKGIIDTIIEPSMTREYLIIALESLMNKRQLRPMKKHGLIPL